MSDPRQEACKYQLRTRELCDLVVHLVYYTSWSEDKALHTSLASIAFRIAHGKQ